MATVTTLAYKDVKTVMTKSSLPVGGFSVNPYVGCPHACRYCYASFMKYGKVGHVPGCEKLAAHHRSAQI